MNKFIAKYLFYCIEFLRREHVYAYLLELENNLEMSRGDLLNFQNKKLGKLLSYAVANNRFYKDKYKNNNISGLFESLPVLTKEELRDNYIRIVSGDNYSKLDLVETSGSTGVPLQLYRDRVTFGYNLASLYRAHRQWGIDIGSKEAMLWGVPVSVRGKIKMKARDFLLNRFREKEYSIHPRILNLHYINCLKKRPEYIFGYSSMVYEFALYLHENKLDLIQLKLKGAICTAEKIHEFQRVLIEKVFGCNVICEYGSTETGIISYECHHGANHISDDTVYVEIVDEKNNPLPDGESGRVLVTVLNSYSAPIIRYDIGDIARKGNYQCPCGSNLSTLVDIEGRSSDIVIGPDGEIYHSIIFYYIIKELTERIGGIKQFKVHQRKNDELEFKIVRGDGYNDKSDLFIRSQIKDKFGDKMNLSVMYVNNIDRPVSGKWKDFETDLDTSSLLKNIYQCRE